ncbi:50S ribosomal protein L5 [Mesoplasma sp. JKS002658]|uniref:50S ribosomal protein L5 n=1 Tax=Mesoplasma whartonense TaxID=2878854 RepID=UPI002022AF25|nr:MULTISPECIES: 50S ribosomal protein L5 [unclassified Mesoplasma]MCL8211378.1 50S ribosomal protein L5 [Mesoplasma sp. JKS002664]MCL8212231.1 50S ribosomal protein L5 [Mesoplasma sp. JKS002662]MCL8212505.1 50S ribosomal protein L5 [Mesoplasma sp. JKS002661]MCL8213373.1 50S ribosomal protein L5 [Mesoplasma sp. JKS002660]MCL8214240.1 50S ribosomal protein L5 [Mesoplasma sp. JKS002658]
MNKSRVEVNYRENIVPELFKEFEYKSVMQVPKISKIVINMGIGDAVHDSKRIEEAAGELALITGQKPLITKAKKSLAVFKLREGMPIGVKVTLRGRKMYDFLDRLINVSLPRVRDFRGVSKTAFDGFGNYTLGIKEQIIFPEIDYDKVQKIRGMDITIVTTAKNNQEGQALLDKMGMPFAK